MRIYDVLEDTEPKATVCVQDDGKKVWKIDPYINFWMGDMKREIERAIDSAPSEAIFRVKSFIIKQRSM